MAGDELFNYPTFVRSIVDALEAANVEYMIGGGLAVWAWGQARTTEDLDVAIYLPDMQIERFSQELLQRGIAMPPDIIRDLIADTRSDLPINAIHGYSGFKADLYPVRENDTFRAIALSRKQEVDIEPDFGRVYVHSPEDLILYKLQYYPISRQTKHVRDIHSILARVKILDMTYIEEWAEYFDVLAIWRDIQASAPK